VSLWRLERIRLLRTPRWAGLLASYLVFGIGMPILTRYQEALFRNVGGEVRVIASPPTPSQAIGAYLSNAMQIGLLVSVLVAAGSLAFDAKPEWAAFLRTRSPSLGALLVPKVATNAIAVGASYAAGLLSAWVGTAALIGSIPPAAILVGGLYGILYLGFAVAAVAPAAAVARSVIGAGGLALALLIVLPIVGQAVPSAEPWLPSALVGAPTAIVDGQGAWSFLRAVGVVAVLTPAMLSAAERLLARREV
jgi:ABC-2 type transport system permease protein